MEVKPWLKKRLEEIKDRVPTQAIAPPSGVVGNRYASKRDKRMIEIVARDLDHVYTPRGAGAKEVRIAVWWVSAIDTGRTTKLRDDTLIDDYVSVFVAPVAPLKPSKKSPPKVSKIAPPLPPKPEPPPVKPLTHFVVALDNSSSMQSIARETVDAFNRVGRSICEGAYKTGQDATLSLVTFGRTIATTFFCDPITNVRTLGYHEYRPDGMTPMFDAVGLTAERLLQRADAKDKHVSFVAFVLTDGEENNSFHYPTHNPGKLIELMAKLNATDRWSFVFMLPPGKKAAFCAKFGIPDGNVTEWETNARGIEAVSRSVDAGVSNFYAQRASGQTSTKGFFTANMAGVSQRDVARKLVDMRGKVRLAAVNRSVMVKDFVEQEFRVIYSLGSAYYQLTKTEEVQHHKGVMLRSRKDGAIYGGADARHVLGLPDQYDVKVKPGDHGDWDIFVQSTSVNRKLVVGTTLLYLM